MQVVGSSRAMFTFAIFMSNISADAGVVEVQVYTFHAHTSIHCGKNSYLCISTFRRKENIPDFLYYASLSGQIPRGARIWNSHFKKLIFLGLYILLLYGCRYSTCN